jgi:LDH2 family malate/lactate/ureidoglycolate dehydrogenase
MLMDILGGVLTGAAFAGEVKNPHLDFSGPQNAGHFFLAIKPDLFMPRAEFEARMDTLVERAKACPRAEGFDEILIPGEPEARAREERLKTGIPLTPDLVDALDEEAAKTGVLPPHPI